MVSFSCFRSSMHSNKPKKTAHLEIHKSAENPVNTLSADCSWNFNYAEKQSQNSPHIKKSLSLGSALDRVGQASSFNDLEGETDIESRSSPNQREDEPPGKDFMTKRIDEWVTNQLDCSGFEDEVCNVVEHQGEKVEVAGRLDCKIDPSMEVAKRYISSLSLTASSAQLANHGLLVIPFLSVFGCLKAINLSGNAIVRITAGSLPRGLHSLNISKNHISVIEGLRDLTRLRVLDLSCNRIIRIGHGLASCSSLKELYLAGNKISDIEGLHRLLKLNVLDLRFNKISTSKSLGELAANYNSLHSINLDGNPAQKNVGDAQLKKYLQGLLPRLDYYNKQAIKTGSLKDIVERSTRLGTPVDRGYRSDRKTLRKGTPITMHSSSTHRVSSSNHGQRHQTGTKNSNSGLNHLMRRSQSEGILSEL
ncbi:uncharacterized protein LOC124910524 [Impatiens glandulifera]|uniref:uncharacterized protein LOC124910524 n=1 Tax=Impatiens glandulifera TaxID=253017 RepID=UPI001FB15B7A|nr:uncharacterized protein LOC124910524 [Impatiens glandulifera]